MRKFLRYRQFRAGDNETDSKMALIIKKKLNEK